MAKRAAQAVANVVEKGYWREGDARVVVEAWQRSGNTLSDFSAEHGVPLRRLSRWAMRLSVPSRETTVRFHPVRVVGASAERREPIEVLLADGRRVRVPEGFAVEELARVLAVLEGRTSC